MEFQRTGRYDLMYMKTQETRRVTKPWDTENIGIENSRENITVDHRHVLKIWENYILELYDRPNQQENFEVEREEEVYCRGERPLLLA
jgi:hypothetical protein